MSPNPPAPPKVVVLLTAAQLAASLPNALPVNVAKFLGPLNATMAKHHINTPLRIAHFLAQIGVESGSLRWAEELASGAAYEGRRNLGNTHPGDGTRFKGRGLIQLTGRANYTAFAEYLNNGTVLLNPAIVATDATLAAETAGWFWETRGCNALADKDEGTLVSKCVNGGTAALPARLAGIALCKSVMGCEVIKA